MDTIEKSTIEHRLDRMRVPFGNFLRMQVFASGMLLLSLVVALVMVNVGWEDTYWQSQEFPVVVQLGAWDLSGNLLGWMNDGLIAVFFFLVGLEIKREYLVGELRPVGRRLLLLAGALGGMAVPAVIYLLVNVLAPDGVTRGWGVPMATDTALAIGVLTLLRKRLTETIETVKLAILLASLVAGVFGFLVLRSSGGDGAEGSVGHR